MQAGWQIREAGPLDLELILQADVFDGPARRNWAMRALGPEDEPDPRNLLILAILEGEVVGFASGTVIDHPDKPTTLFINELGVNAPAQRQGIGRALFLAIRSEGRARGCQTSWVTTEGDNTAARALYLAAGGAETPDIVTYDWDETRLPR
jgi:ribosomal protein S18 acetylase RimI-like enzyme